MHKRRYKYTVWEGPLRQAQGPKNPCGMPAFALKGQNMKAQGNALGKWPNKIPSPEGATYTNLGHRPRYTIHRPSQP